MRIHPSVPYRSDETPTSVVSRLAMLHRSPSIRIFSLDMGIPFQSVIDGEQEALATVAELVDAPVDQLARASIVRSDGQLLLRGQGLAKPMMRRARTLVCPCCLAEDIQASPYPWMVSGRFQWLIDAIHTCRVHGVALVEVSVTNSPSLLNDFARLVSPTFDEIRAMADDADELASSTLEDYLLDRLDGGDGPAWLDALPWHAAAKTCQMLGAVAVFGTDASIKTMRDDQWHEAGTAGYAIASEGPEGIRAFLDKLRSQYEAARSDSAGPQAWFGRLHAWLASRRLPGFEPVRDVVIDMVGDVEPVGPEDRLYDRPIVERRRLHSIRTAALQVGMHPKRLRKLLASSGVIPPDHGKMTDDRLLFCAEAAKEVLDKATNAISEREAETYLTAGRVQTKVLANAGLIKPFVAPGQGGLRHVTYDKRELDAFIGRLTVDAEVLTHFDDPIHRIPDAAKRANCSAVEIVEAVLDGRLRWKGQAFGEKGYLSVLVDVDEVRKLVRGDHGDLLPLTLVQSSLKTTFRVVEGLVSNGILPSERAISPRNRCPYTAVRKLDLEAFQRTYGALHELAKERRVHFLSLKKALTAREIEPALGKPAIQATFYRRSDIPPDL